uniref:tRNA lysidine(34) synthetase TilS n=1 Tax=Brugia timori TaxID=42155 RepID=A0A0R3Q6P3_9BILA
LCFKTNKSFWSWAIPLTCRKEGILDDDIKILEF